jgi:RNA polymerase sigma factor (TIGR02999 family)
MAGDESRRDGAEGDPITSWIGAARSGDRDAADRLYEAVYGELRRIARSQRRRLRPSDTLSTTALVNELYLRLARGARLAVADRHHFYSLAARAVRQILIDGARRGLADRRGGGASVEPSSSAEDFVAPERPEELIALDEALRQLAAVDCGLATVVELHFFGGLSFAEMAAASERSERTLRRDWRRARAFLHDRLVAAG